MEGSVNVHNPGKKAKNLCGRSYEKIVTRTVAKTGSVPVELITHKEEWCSSLFTTEYFLFHHFSSARNF